MNDRGAEKRRHPHDILSVAMVIFQSGAEFACIDAALALPAAYHHDELGLVKRDLGPRLLSS
jgi:hypothetical protein